MPSWSTGRWVFALMFWRYKYLIWLIVFTGKSMKNFFSSKLHTRLSRLVLFSLSRTCVKWPQKPSPQDRPALKLNFDEQPTLVSVYNSFHSSLLQNKQIIQLWMSYRIPLWFSFSWSAATRMIANALSNDSPPSTPVRRPDNRLSVTVSNMQQNKSTKAGRHCRNVKMASSFYPFLCISEPCVSVFPGLHPTPPPPLFYFTFV